MNYLIAGGGTGGHIYPAVAIGEALLAKRPDARIHFVGTRYGMEKDLIPKLGYPLLTLPIRGFLGKGIAGKAALLWRLPLSVLLSLWMLIRYRPGAVIGVGGYASGPLLWVAAILRFPCCIQEQNAYPGVTNKLLSKWVKLALCGFPEAGEHFPCPSLTTGNPIRSGFRGESEWSRDRATILILGGSQGAKALNETVPDLLKRSLGSDSGRKVIHQCGRNHQDQVKKAYAGAPFPVQVVPFIEDLPKLMTDVLLVICRAGASTLSELQSVKIPALLVPFPRAAHDHQMFNARSLAATGAAEVIPEPDLVGAGDLMNHLLHDMKRLEEMARSYGSDGPDSASLCAELILELEQKTEVSALVKKYGQYVSQN